MKGKPEGDSGGALRGRNHPQFEGPIGNPKAGKQKRYSFKGGWHTGALVAVAGAFAASGITPEHAVKALTGNAHK